MKHWQDRIAFVTGAGSGIGAAVCAALAERGARVVASDRDGDAAARTAEAVRGMASHLDVTDAEAFAAEVRRVEVEWGPIDALFNNAGVGLAGAVEDLSLDDWRRMFEVNTMGTVHGVHTVYPGMVARRRGVIVNTASGAGLCPRPGMTPYAASKFAVVGLSVSLRAEAALHGVGVHAVCPGYIQTEIMNRTSYRGLDARGLRDSIPIQPMPAARCAEVMLRGVRRGQAVIPVTMAAGLEWRLYRWFPGLVNRIAAARARAFSRHRVSAPDRDAPEGDATRTPQ